MKKPLYSLAILVGLLRLNSLHSFGIHSFTVAARPSNTRTTLVDDEAAIKFEAPEEQATAAATALSLTYEDAIRVIDECSVQERPNEQLYNAVRLLEQKAYKFYPGMSDKLDLWDRAQGSWKLIFSTGDAKTREFHPPTYLLPFSFAMIRGEHFGNGFGLGENLILLSVLQKHYFNPRIRYMAVTVQDIYVGGHKATDFFPDCVKNAINLGKTPADFVDKPCPAFCLLAATENALVARGNQSGALAIWKRLPCDMHRVAYKDLA